MWLSGLSSIFPARAAASPRPWHVHDICWRFARPRSALYILLLPTSLSLILPGRRRSRRSKNARTEEWMPVTRIKSGGYLVLRPLLEYCSNIALDSRHSRTTTRVYEKLKDVLPSACDSHQNPQTPDAAFPVPGTPNLDVHACHRTHGQTPTHGLRRWDLLFVQAERSTLLAALGT